VPALVAQAVPEAFDEGIEPTHSRELNLRHSWKWSADGHLPRDAQIMGEVAADKLEGIVRALRSVRLAVPVVLEICYGVGFFSNNELAAADVAGRGMNARRTFSDLRKHFVGSACGRGRRARKTRV